MKIYISHVKKVKKNILYRLKKYVMQIINELILYFLYLFKKYKLNLTRITLD